GNGTIRPVVLDRVVVRRKGRSRARVGLTSCEPIPGNRRFAGFSCAVVASFDDAERVLLTDLCRRSSELATSRRLAQRFVVPARERRGTQLEGWIAEVQSTGPAELRGFSRDLHRDWQAMHASQ